ncbi:S8 family serine peptidase [Flavobacterium sp. KACC 22761]|uniref:S8 family serine peptidase n=1 Tax=Flavobacterium sp. KACC 22761 TaxID=3092665 RepID=UPI002A74E2CE|nr:S8 family serine peptidase [Flavobacterium sp. KACC 22761]WPO77927.1 S8 family serine peptidase [Flavobacterium sp. KACC 22761]
MDPRLKIILYGNPDEELSLLMRLEKEKDYPNHCTIISEFGTIVSIRTKRRFLKAIYDSKKVFSLKAPTVIPADETVEEIPETQILDKKNDILPATVSNAVFGIIDFGFDFTHPDFIENGKTRFEKIWIQSGRYDGNRYGYGRIITEAQINEALLDEFPFKKLGYHPGKTDLFGNGTHGTHVLGIACGNGSVAPKSFAPNVKIIAVDMGINYVNGSNLSLGDSVKGCDGLHFIKEAATDRALVVNMSLGGHGDAHMGVTLLEQVIDHIVTNRKGTAIVQSTGNYHQGNTHTYGDIKTGQKIKIPWMFKKNDRTPNEMEIWYHGDDVLSVIIYDDDQKVLLSSTPFKDELIVKEGDEVGICLHRCKEPNTNKNQINILVNGKLNSKFWTVELVGNKVSNGRYHCYIERDDGGQSIFLPAVANKTHTTNSICNSKYSIVVGAYNQNDETKPILSFSSSGPTADGRMKPELVAPGYKIKSSCSSSSRENRASNKLTSKSGSSMAAPYVASLVLKILDKEPQLDIRTIRKRLFDACDPAFFKDSKFEIFRSGHGYINPNKIL